MMDMVSAPLHTALTVILRASGKHPDIIVEQKYDET